MGKKLEVELDEWGAISTRHGYYKMFPDAESDVEREVCKLILLREFIGLIIDEFNENGSTEVGSTHGVIETADEVWHKVFEPRLRRSYEDRAKFDENGYHSPIKIREV